jgi:hypothetical protein
MNEPMNSNHGASFDFGWLSTLTVELAIAVTLAAVDPAVSTALAAANRVVDITTTPAAVDMIIAIALAALAVTAAA